MGRKGFFSNWKNITQISIGLVYILFLSWLIFHTLDFVPLEQYDYWFKVFISYGILNALIIGSADIRNKLFSVRLIDFAPRFLMFFSVSIILFYFMLQFIDPTGSSIFTLLTDIPVWLAIIHAFVFATTESVIWQGFLDYKVGVPASAFIAGLFHWGIWEGSAFVVIPAATLLFLFFSFVNWYFRKNTNDVVPAVAVHTAWNLVKLGSLVALGGVVL
jgi:hypothetical protein